MFLISIDVVVVAVVVIVLMFGYLHFWYILNKNTTFILFSIGVDVTVIHEISSNL
jgi:hypothetical protein